MTSLEGPCDECHYVPHFVRVTKSESGVRLVKLPRGNRVKHVVSVRPTAVNIRAAHHAPRRGLASIDGVWLAPIAIWMTILNASTTVTVRLHNLRQHWSNAYSDEKETGIYSHVALKAPVFAESFVECRVATSGEAIDRII